MSLTSSLHLKDMFYVLVEFLGGISRGQTIAQISDEDLVKQMHAGDDFAFKQLFDRYIDRLFGFVVKRVGNRTVAEDLVSDIFMKAFTHRQSFVWKTSFSAWIFRIATNRITDHYRTKKVEDDLETFSEVLRDPTTPVTERTDLHLLHTELEQALEQLKERDRLVITLKYYGQCSQEELGQALNCAPSTAGTILSRALKTCEKKASPTLKKYLD